MCGPVMIAVSWMLLLGQPVAGGGRNNLEIRQRRSQEAFKEFRDISEALGKGAERRVVSGQFLDLATRYSETDHGREARELGTLLQKMAEEDEQFHAPKDAGALSQQQQITLCIHRLRDVAATDLSVPGSIKVLWNSHDPNNPAVALRKIGKPAVPALIELLADRRPTRSVGNPRNGNYVLRYNDAALQILQSLTGQRFTELPGRGRYLSNYPDATQEQVRLEIHRWWEANKDKDEAQWLRESLSQSGVGAMQHTLDLAERLVELEGSRSVDFLRERLRAEPNNSFVVSLLWKAGGKDVVEDIRPKIHNENVQVRAAAYEALLSAGETSLVDVVVADFAKVIKNPDRERWDHEPLIYVLAKADSEKAILVAARLTRHPDPRVARSALVAFEGILETAHKPAPHLRRIVVPYMVAAALDAKESGGFAVLWLIKGGYIDVSQVRGDQDSAVSRIRTWWQAHSQEYPKTQEWDPSWLDPDR